MKRTSIFLLASLLAGTATASDAAAAGRPRMDADKQRVVEHWTPARRQAAVPRDLLLDRQNRGYLRRADGSLVAYGQDRGADAPLQSVNPAPIPTATAKPGGGGGDTTGPTISSMVPAANATIGASASFSALVTDAGSGVRSVSFVVKLPSGQTQSFTPSHVGGGTWQTSISGFTDGAWSWQVVARDNAARGGNTTTSASVPFAVDTGSGGGGGGGGGAVTSNAPWSGGGAVQTAAGRIYFEMPSNSRRTRWGGYVCSGTVAADETMDRSIIITAAHCVYDDVNKAFARNVLFIPNQDDTTGAGTDRDCSNDPIGCWAPSFGVVDSNWTTRVFPDNVAWDYAFYVVNDSGAHQGAAASSSALDLAAGTLTPSFVAPAHDQSDASDYSHALGYSYSDDPNFMYCAEDMGTKDAVNWWLPNCGLSGGASGGPWIQPMSGGSGPLISVNSWGYTTAPGMAGPKLSGSSAACVFSVTRSQNWLGTVADGNAGVKVSWSGASCSAQ